MIEDYIKKENSLADSKIKQDMNAGFRSIQNNGGYEYNTYVYTTDSNGKKVIMLDQKNNPITKKVKFNVKFENDQWVVDESTFVDENGQTMTASDIAETELVGLGNYDLVSKIDKIAKTSNGIINAKKQNIQELKIDGIQANNDAIDAIIKQYQDAKDAKLHSSEMRQKEMSSKYIANRKNE